jgi:hypothetical protein
LTRDGVGTRWPADGCIVLRWPWYFVRPTIRMLATSYSNSRHHCRAPRPCSPSHLHQLLGPFHNFVFEKEFDLAHVDTRLYLGVVSRAPSPLSRLTPGNRYRPAPPGPGWCPQAGALPPNDAVAEKTTLTRLGVELKLFLFCQEGRAWGPAAVPRHGTGYAEPPVNRQTRRSPAGRAPRDRAKTANRSGFISAGRAPLRPNRGPWTPPLDPLVECAPTRKPIARVVAEISTPGP